MFSGIVEELAEVAALKMVESGARLAVKSLLDHSNTEIGDSIAVNGVCLTLVNSKDGILEFEIAEETLRKTTLGRLEAGSKLNLERSLVVGDRISGHFVFGHVDGTSELLSRVAEGNSEKLTFSLTDEVRPFVAKKGSIALDGVSLTVGEASGSKFSVYVIPHTSKVTTLGHLKAGSEVNLEADMLARYVWEQTRAVR